MRLKRIAPVVAAVTGVAGLVGMQASPAAASSHKDTCSRFVCLWYSSGYSSGIWASDQSIVWSNFSYDFIDYKTPQYDHYVNGNGANQGVRNNAHSMGSANGTGGDLLYSLPDTKGKSFALGYDSGVAVTLPQSGTHALRNNNASYKSTNCSVIYQGHAIC